MQEFFFNADDFGYSAEINAAIRDCFRNNYISTASLLVNMKYTSEAVGIIKEERLESKTGLHFNLTEGKPLTDAIQKLPRFCNKEGDFITSRKHRFLFLLKAEKKAVKDELLAQIDKFKAGVGCTPVYIDSHNHIHEEWGIFKIVLQYAKSANCKIRKTKNLGKQTPVNYIYRKTLNFIIDYHKLAHSSYFGSYDDFKSEINSNHHLAGISEIMIHPKMNQDNIIFDFFTHERLLPLIEESSQIAYNLSSDTIPQKVSVIIPVYNGELLIERCLESIYTQKGNFELEVIVIDDGSIDNSIDVVKRYNKEIVIIQQTNQGPAAARNKGIEAASGKYTTFIDADDYWKPEFLQETIRFMVHHPDAIAVNTGQLHKMKGKKDGIMPRFLKKKNHRKFKSELIDEFFSFWATHNHICTGSALLRTEITKKSGGQRTDLRITEDLEFWAFLSTFGKWGFIPKILFVSDGGAVTDSVGWIIKMKHRWENAPTVEDWERRIISKLNLPLSTGYLKSRGLIARNLAYSQLLSGRTELSREQVHKYGPDFPNDKIARLMKTGAKNDYLWRLVCKLLIYREINR
jgi:glycosyltransferase involved in cell wall biosynthesis/predicted glycoside hydrolase/deacetylase ChbG (UPF0249 family)